MGDHGFRISKSGIDVLSGDDKDMVLTSKQSVFKGGLSGSGATTVQTDGTARIITIAHGLGYIPMVEAFWADANGIYFNTRYYQIPTHFFPDPLVFVLAYSDSTNVYLEFSLQDLTPVGAPANITVDYQYFIFIDKGKL